MITKDNNEDENNWIRVCSQLNLDHLFWGEKKKSLLNFSSGPVLVHTDFQQTNQEGKHEVKHTDSLVGQFLAAVIIRTPHALIKPW